MLCPKIIHIHIPRTGGQTIRAFLGRRAGVVDWVKTHRKLVDMRNQAEKLWPGKSIPSFCVVRNPWDWYVSRYFHIQRDIAAGLRQNNVEMEHAGNNLDGFQKHLQLLGEIRDGDKIIRDSNGNIGRTGRTWWYLSLTEWHNHLSAPGPDYVLRFENLAEDLAALLKFLLEFDEKDTKAQLQRPLNASTHRPFQEYYTPELAEMVGRWDAEYISRFEYNPPIKKEMS